LSEKLSYSAPAVKNKCLQIIGHVSPGLRDNLKMTFPSLDLADYLSTSLNNFVNRIYRFRDTYGNKKEAAKLVLRNLAYGDLAEKIKQSYAQDEANPQKLLGKLLDAVYYISFDTDRKTAEMIAQQVVDNVDLKDLRVKKEDRLTELSFLVRNAGRCSEAAGKQLCNRISSEFAWTDYITVPLDKGLPPLLLHFHTYDDEKAKEFTNKIVNLDFNRVLEDSEPEELSRLFWALLLIDESKVTSWISGTEKEKWLAKLISCLPKYSFQLLWLLYNADEDRGRTVTHAFATRFLPNLSVLSVEVLPLLGFFSFLGIEFYLDIPYPSLDEILQRSSEDLNLGEIAFCAYFLQKKEKELSIKFLKEVPRILASRFPGIPIEEIIGNYPLQKTRNVIKGIFGNYPVGDHSD